MFWSRPMGILRGTFKKWFVGVLSAVVGCGGQPPVPPPAARIAVGHPGSFQITEIASNAEGEGTTKIWLATVVRGEKRIQFRVELLLKSQKASPFAFAKGAFVREKDSDGSAFLAELAKVLQAKKIPETSGAVERLEFDAAILGMNLSRQGGADQFVGSFTPNPAGPWIAVKVFVAAGDG